jgi:hypothetical protein
MGAGLWVLVAAHAFGGVTEIGFLPDAPRLLVASHQGRSEYDLVTGMRIARDRNENFSEWFDASGPACLALSTAEPTWIAVAGLAGGTLPDTAGQWRLTVTGERAAVTAIGGSEQVSLCDGEEVRAVGFSPDG